MLLIFEFEVQTGVEIRFHVDSSDWIPEWIRTKLKQNVDFSFRYLNQTVNF